MWNSFEEWANTIENLDLEIFHNSKKNREEIYDKTGIWSHVYARIYETPYEEVINPLLIPNNYFKIPLIGISYEQKPEYSFSSAHKFNQIGKEEEIDLTPTSTSWELLGTERVRHPWHSFRAAWNIVAPLCIGGMNALVWWLRNAMHTSISPIVVETEGVSAEDLTVFWNNMEEIAQMVYVEAPFGKKLVRLPSNPMDHHSPKELKQEIDMSIAEYLLGQSLSTRMDKGGSYAAVVAEIDRISAPLLRLELAQFADAINAAWMPRWAKFRGVASDMTLEWQVASLDDRLKESEIKANESKSSTGGKGGETK